MSTSTTISIDVQRTQPTKLVAQAVELWSDWQKTGESRMLWAVSVAGTIVYTPLALYGLLVPCTSVASEISLICVPKYNALLCGFLNIAIMLYVLYSLNTQRKYIIKSTLASKILQGNKHNQQTIMQLYITDVHSFVWRIIGRYLYKTLSLLFLKVLLIFPYYHFMQMLKERFLFYVIPSRVNRNKS